MELQTVNVDEHVQAGKEAIVYARELPIETAMDMETASAMREAIKARQKAVTALLNPIIKAANDAHKAGTKRRGEILAPLEEAESILNKKMTTWQTAEEARLAEEQKKLDEEEKLRAAIQEEAAGNKELAEAIMEDQVPVTAAPVEKAKTSGVSFTETWKFVVEDYSKIPPQFMMPNEQAIRTHVIAMKDRAVIPGVRIYKEKGIKSTSKKLTTRAW